MLERFRSGWFGGLFAPGAGPLEQAAMQTALAAEAARVETIARARAAYDGDLPDPLAPTRDGQRDAVKTNHLETTVDTSAAFLMAPGPLWDLPDLPEADDAPPASTGHAAPDHPTVAWLKAALAATDWPAKLLDLAINGDVSGTAYLRLYPADADSAYPRIVVLDPTCMRLDCDPADCDRIVRYLWTWNTTDATGRPLVRRQRIERDGPGWAIYDEHAGVDALAWTLDDTTPWRYPWAPVDHAKNWPNPNSPYGKPGVTDLLIGLNAARNFNLSNRQRIDRYHSTPLTTLTGADGVSVLDRAAGTVIELPEGATLDEHYPHVDSTSGENLGREIFEAICELSRTPSIVLGRTEHESNPSGVALRVKMWPTIIKTELKQTLYGPLLERVLVHLLELGGLGVQRVALTWPELLPTDPLTERQVLVMDRQAGVLSREGWAEAVGRDWAQERARLLAEGADLPPAPGAAKDPQVAQAVARSTEMFGVSH